MAKKGASTPPCRIDAGQTLHGFGELFKRNFNNSPKREQKKGDERETKMRGEKDKKYTGIMHEGARVTTDGQR